MEKSKHDDQHRDRFRKDKKSKVVTPFFVSVCV